MKKFLLYISAITTIIASLAINEVSAAERPRLLVNIVVSGMRTDDLVRYNKNFSNGGFNRLINNGAYFTNASYDYMQTTTPVGLATLSTGAMPSTHGVVSDSWFDYVGNKRVSLIEDSKEQCVNYSGDAIGYSPRQLIAETISDAMIQSDSTSQVATIAIEPLSAIVTAGHSGEVYWMETLQTAWTTSSYYAKELPAWITQYNQTDKNLDFLTKRWNALLEYDNYLNSRVACIEGLKSKQNKRIDHIEEDASAIKEIFSDEYEQMCYTPTGNSALLAFAKQMVANNKMGGDEVPDILNIVLDTPRKICSRFGPESVEYEDMLYRLDRDLEEFISFVTAQVTDPQQIVVTLCSDHGTSPSFDIESNHVERFNIRQDGGAGGGEAGYRFKIRISKMGDRPGKHKGQTAQHGHDDPADANTDQTLAGVKAFGRLPAVDDSACADRRYNQNGPDKGPHAGHVAVHRTDQHRWEHENRFHPKDQGNDLSDHLKVHSRFSR